MKYTLLYFNIRTRKHYADSWQCEAASEEGDNIHVGYTSAGGSFTPIGTVVLPVITTPNRNEDGSLRLMDMTACSQGYTTFIPEPKAAETLESEAVKLLQDFLKRGSNG